MFLRLSPKGQKPLDKSIEIGQPPLWTSCQTFSMWSLESLQTYYFFFFNVMILVGDGGEDDDAVDNGGDGDLSGEEGGGRKETGGDVSHGELVWLTRILTHHLAVLNTD